MRLYIGLVHYPVYNKNGTTIASAITTYDVHDISRLAKTYGVRKYFIINPLQDQQALGNRILNHWVKGYGATYNRDRKEALELVALCSTIHDARDEIAVREGKRPCLIATGASVYENRSIDYHETRIMIHDDQVIFILFGTAWGLAQEVMDQADYVLNPIKGASEYNHLSVRAAAAIILDRVAGQYE